MFDVGIFTSECQVNDKIGGYINRLVVTCVRSGVNRPFRVLQKPERAPIRAIRASSSGRLGWTNFYFNKSGKCSL